MNENMDLDELAHELARRHREKIPAQTLDDEVLRAWLDGQQSAEIAARLAHDAVARERLAELAGSAAPTPPPAIRARLLGDNKRPAPRQNYRLAAVLALLTVGVMAWLGAAQHRHSTQRVAFNALSFDVTPRGLAEYRGAAGTDADVSAHADTTISISVTPSVSSALPLQFAVYAGHDTTLQRLRDVDVTITRGAAVLRFSPQQLGELAPGVLRLATTVGLQTPPPTLPANAAAATSDALKRFDYTLRIVAPPTEETIR